MAALVIFLAFSAFMFGAGYQWRKLQEEHARRPATDGPAPPRHTLWDGMVGKI